VDRLRNDLKYALVGHVTLVRARGRFGLTGSDRPGRESTCSLLSRRDLVPRVWGPGVRPSQRWSDARVGMRAYLDLCDAGVETKLLWCVSCVLGLVLFSVWWLPFFLFARLLSPSCMCLYVYKLGVRGATV